MPGVFLWGCYNGDTRDWRPVKVKADGSLVVDIVTLNISNIFNTAYVAAADILPAAITPTVNPSMFRVQCAFDVAGVLAAVLTEGGVPITVYLNRNVALLANSLYTFDVVAGSIDTVNFTFSQNCTILSFKVVEIHNIT